MKALIYKIEDVLRELAITLDYLIYIIINPFKFKRFPKKINKILIVELLQIGDLIVTTPTIRALREKYKEATIDILVLPKMKDVLIGNPDLDRLIPYSNNFLSLVKRLRQERYDLGIILHPGSLIISLALLLSRIKFRVGSAKAGVLSGKGFFLNKKIKPNLKIQHKIEDNLDVLRSIKIDTKNKNPEISATKESELNVNNFLKKYDIKDYIVMHPGANYKTHEWPIEKYAKLADTIIETHKISIIFTGSRNERILINNLMHFMDKKAYDFSGRTIKDFFSIIKNADSVITGDTSASHIASALDKPVVTLFGASNPDVWHPYTKKGKSIYKREKCTNCNKNFCFRLGDRKQECMNSITVKDVLNEVKSK